MDDMNSGVMPTASSAGLLDLTVEVSVDQIFSASQFAVFLHIRNPFPQPVFIRSVSTKLPTQVVEVPKDVEPKSEKESSEVVAMLHHEIEDQKRAIEELEQRFDDLDPADGGDAVVASRLWERLADRRDRLREAQGRLLAVSGGFYVEVGGSAEIENFSTVTKSGSMVRISENAMLSNVSLSNPEDEMVYLSGSLPAGTPLMPGSSEVRAIRLSSGSSPFFLPAKFRAHFSVSFAFRSAQADNEMVHSNSIGYSLTIRSAIRNLLLGGVAGGVLGSIARILQDGGDLWSGKSLATVSLMTILGVASIVFASRKSDAQTFVTVEDFWGASLVAFLIGYGGTAAFQSLIDSGVS